MESLTGEREIAQRGSLTLTNYRLVQEHFSWIKSMYKEIPIDRIDSIQYESRRSLLFLIIGIILILTGIIIGQFDDDYLLVAVFGSLILLIALLWKKEFIEFRSASMIIREEKRGIEAFADSVRKQMYQRRA